MAHRDAMIPMQATRLSPWKGWERSKCHRLYAPNPIAKIKKTNRKILFIIGGYAARS